MMQLNLEILKCKKKCISRIKEIWYFAVGKIYQNHDKMESGVLIRSYKIF
jgi:hypothetical protein